MINLIVLVVLLPVVAYVLLLVLEGVIRNYLLLLQFVLAIILIYFSFKS